MRTGQTGQCGYEGQAARDGRRLIESGQFGEVIEQTQAPSPFNRSAGIVNTTVHGIGWLAGDLPGDGREQTFLGSSNDLVACDRQSESASAIGNLRIAA
ncbi:hypothetical protein D3C81_1559290 [compost metagenome]